VLVVPVIPAGDVVPCGGLMFRSVGHGRGGDVYLYICTIHTVVLSVPVAAQSKAWVYGRSPAAIVGSNPTETWMFVCCVLSGRGLCDELITHTEHSYRL
jgi:hypothetical protein